MIKIANVPDAFSPFFKVLETVQGHLESIIPKATDQPTREMFEQILAELKSRQSEFALTGPQAVSEGVSRTNAALGQLVLLEQKKGALLADIEVALAKSEASLAYAQAKLADLEAQPAKKPSMPRKRLKKVAAALEFSPGKTLRDWLVPAEAPKASSTPHTHGNIWDNWKAVPPPVSGQEDGLFEDDTE